MSFYAGHYQYARSISDWAKNRSFTKLISMLGSLEVMRNTRTKKDLKKNGTERCNCPREKPFADVLSRPFPATRGRRTPFVESGGCWTERREEGFYRTRQDGQVT